MSAGEVQHQYQKKSDESCGGAPTPAVAKDQAAVEASDRGLFDFLGKKKEEKKEGEVIASEFDEKVKVSDEKKKHEGLSEKLHRSSSSSSSSSEEERSEGGEKKKKKKAPKEKKSDVKIEEKKGFLDKIKEKFPGGKKAEEVASPGGKKAEEVASPPPTPSVTTECASTPEAEEKEKKSFFEKFKDKLPGHGNKNGEAKGKEHEYTEK